MSKPGQSNLFSFFTKKKTAPVSGGGGSGGVSASASQPKESPPASAPASKSAVVSTVTPMEVVEEVAPAVQASSSSLAASPEGAESKLKRAQVVGADSSDDDDQGIIVKRQRPSAKVANTTTAVTGGSKRKARVVLESDKEDEWDGEESESEASVGDGDNSEDDDDFLADSDEDSDEGEGESDDDSAISESESEDELPKRAKKKSHKKSSQAAAALSCGKTKKRARLGPSTTTPTGRNGAASKASALLTLPSGDVNGRTMSLDVSGGGGGGKGKPADMDALYLADRMLAEPPAASQKQSQYVANDHMVRVLPSGVCGQGCHEHDLLDWLTPALRKDAQRRPMSHPDYNPRTLYVPPDFLKAQTPGHMQWWELKSANMDTILFFKVGKFYELYHMDADVGMSELDLVYMKGDKAHSGFPEVSYGKYAGMLVNKGYRVARVEQTETPDQLKERNARTAGKAIKVVRRELCSVMTKGTRTYCHLDDLTTLLQEEKAGVATAQSSSVLMCIKEVPASAAAAADGACAEYGVCVVDAVIGTITLAQFQDDKQRSRLRTMIARFAPSEVLLEHNKEGEAVRAHSEETLGCVKLMASAASVDFLRGEEMPSADGAVKVLKKGEYFAKADGRDSGDEVAWPEVMRVVLQGVSDGSSSLVMSAIGGALWQLKRSFIDHDIFSLGKVAGYVPPDEAAAAASTQDEVPSAVQTALSNATDVDGAGGEHGEHMILDAVSLANLEILLTSFEQKEKGSLWAFVNRCMTPFGRRLLRGWLCKPLCNSAAILRRSAAVRELNTELADECSTIRGHLKSLVDLERLLGRIHSNGSSKRGAGGAHPDCRAVMFEMSTYNTRKIKDFATALGGFEKVLKAGRAFTDAAGQNRLQSATLLKIAATFPTDKMAELLTFFRSVFDERSASKEGKVVPKPGVDDDYDAAKADIKTEMQGLDGYMKEMMQETGIKSLKYYHANKDRYQIEVPVDMVNRLPGNWTLKSSKKTHRRYWTPTIISALGRLVDAEAREKLANTDTLRKLFERFDGSREVWAQGLACMAQLDALLSLADVSAAPGYTWPDVLNDQETGGAQVLDIVGGRHPMLEYAMEAKGGEYIPNSLSLGGKVAGDCNPRLLLLSGPNMGGKSTLLRQTCLITILAQLGCAVPAETCTLTPVDRIFTRVGASDRILAGQSTFYVELAETAIILKAATRRSLCILDELGRGTATHDGTAIAHAVVDKLVRETCCRTLFATHYHSLADDWGIDPRVKLGHMDCMVQNDGGSAADEDVTFLYRLADGSSPKSYGVNVAKLAALPSSVVAMAVQRSQEFESRMNAHAGASESRAYCVEKAYFNRLCSLVSSDMPDTELAHMARVVWTAFKATEASACS